ncbi:uncharacterized protein LOC103477558 isoform X2 [Poecilia reticulata]|uniref:uncharacterized protein LOC103477558 isoform X2 n=1 Tax=Poecilia reticulata TaxID=8081 RepID=UPI0007EBB91C|nr:PREDICTED: uncharacterized protein LOC103477558 isoform X2 [Poecilia reticulata]
MCLHLIGLLMQTSDSVHSLQIKTFLCPIVSTSCSSCEPRSLLILIQKKLLLLLLRGHVSISVSGPEGALLPLPEEAGSAELLGCSCRDCSDHGGCAECRPRTGKNKHSSGGFHQPGSCLLVGRCVCRNRNHDRFSGSVPFLLLGESNGHVGFTVFLNIVGAIFSITGIVLYAIDLTSSSLLWVCDRSGSDPDRYDDSCRNVAAFDQNLLTSLDRALILLAVLLLVLSISFAALGIGFLTGEVKEEEVDNVSKEDLKEILLISPGA